SSARSATSSRGCCSPARWPTAVASSSTGPRTWTPRAWWCGPPRRCSPPEPSSAPATHADGPTRDRVGPFARQAWAASADRDVALHEAAGEGGAVDGHHQARVLAVAEVPGVLGRPHVVVGDVRAVDHVEELLDGIAAERAGLVLEDVLTGEVVVVGGVLGDDLHLVRGAAVDLLHDAVLLVVGEREDAVTGHHLGVRDLDGLVARVVGRLVRGLVRGLVGRRVDGRRVRGRVLAATAREGADGEEDADDDQRADDDPDDDRDGALLGLRGAGAAVAAAELLPVA